MNKCEKCCSMHESTALNQVQYKSVKKPILVVQPCALLHGSAYPGIGESASLGTIAGTEPLHDFQSLFISASFIRHAWLYMFTLADPQNMTDLGCH